MGIQSSGRQFDKARPIVAFDFDGTLTTRDSFLAYLAFQAGPVGYAAGLAWLTPSILSYGVHQDRERLKAAAVRVFLRGVSPQTLSANAQRFTDQAAPRLLRPDALQCWATWKARGAVMTIVTASPEATVAPFAERIGADLLIGTGLQIGADGLYTGGFSTKNCRAQEKVLRLKVAFGEDMVLAAAYGDTTGDTEMLAMAQERGYRVFTRRP